MEPKTSTTMRFYVGTYNREGPYFQATGQGLHTCELDRQTGCIAALAVNGDIVNATYLAKQPGANRLFAACDLYLSPGILCGCDIQDDGSVACRSARSAHGQSVCHVARNTVGTIAAVSSYLDGKISLHAINGTMICDVSTVWQYTGSSVNARRQESAHAHQAVFAPNDSALYVCDLGSDRIWLHDPTDWHRPPAHVVAPAGYGPRHLVCHPRLPYVYVFCELSAMLLTYRSDAPDVLTLLDEAPTLPADFSGEPAGAAVMMHPSLRTLYVSNRNSDTIGVLRLDDAQRPRLERTFASLGKDPRDLAIAPDGGWLLAANQRGHNVAVFELSPDTGLPTGRATQPFSCGSPACVLFH